MNTYIHIILKLLTSNWMLHLIKWLVGVQSSSQFILFGITDRYFMFLIFDHIPLQVFILLFFYSIKKRWLTLLPPALSPGVPAMNVTHCFCRSPVPLSRYHILQRPWIVRNGHLAARRWRVQFLMINWSLIHGFQKQGPSPSVCFNTSPKVEKEGQVNDPLFSSTGKRHKSAKYRNFWAASLFIQMPDFPLLPSIKQSNFI